MKVLHIIPSISHKRGGPSTAILNMVRYLRSEGVDAAILTTNDNMNYRDNTWPLGRWVWISEVPIIIFPTINLEFKLLEEYLISPSLSCWLIRNIKNYDALHIHSIFSYASTTSMLIARLYKIPYTVRTIGQLNSWSLSQSRWKKILMLFFIEKANLNRSYAIHVTSNFEKQDVRLICKHKTILCLELGVDIPNKDIHPIQSSNQVTRFIFLSRIHPKKQLHLLLRAFSMLYKKNPEQTWHLFVVGAGESNYVSSLKQLALEYGIGDLINWMGHLDGEDKTNLLKQSDWFVLPSISENFGISAVEALAHGVPIIISQEVGISDIVEEYHAGLICGDSLNLEDALSIALEGASMEMRFAAVRLVKERFCWQKIAFKLACFYKDGIIHDDGR
jgi:glycosyltransferase involved in cell wall biosynthesis